MKAGTATISSGDDIVPLLVELDQAEAVAERIREHRLAAVGQLEGVAFPHRTGRDGLGGRRIQVVDGEIGMDRAPMPRLIADAAAGGADRCA